MNIAESIGIILTIVFGVIAAGKYLIGLYFKMSHKEEELRQAAVRHEISTIKDSVRDNRDSMTTFRRDFDDFRIAFAKHSQKMESMEKAAEAMGKQWEATAKELEARYRAMENAELIKVGANTFILKGR